MLRLLVPLCTIAALGCARSTGSLTRAGGTEQAVQVRLCKAVDVIRGGAGVARTEPVEAGDVFYVSDWRVVAWVSMGELKRSRKVRWVWFDPSGDRYVDSGDHFANPKGGAKRFNQAWHALRIWGEPASQRPGRWNVTFYVDGEPAASRDFTLRAR